MTHTPGEWFCSEDFTMVLARGMTWDHEVCEVFPGGGGSRLEDNARLIAAAPDLLAACESALNCLIEAVAKLRATVPLDSLYSERANDAIEALTAQRQELLVALINAEGVLSGLNSGRNILNEIRAAISKASK